MFVADKHPYVSGSGPLFQIVNQLRKSFPAGGVTADTLKKLGLAPNNESYVINILRFIGIIDEEGKKTEAAGKVFNQHDDAAFQKAFAGLVKSAYSDLFSLHGDDAWKLDLDALIQYFRSTDDTSAIVGRRQATTFQGLSALSGHAEAPQVKASPVKKTQAEKAAPKKLAKKKDSTIVSEKEGSEPNANSGGGGTRGRDVGLTVRIEINLPADGNQETYDRIFKSIRENLIDAE
jgi:hypothetical protein